MILSFKETFVPAGVAGTKPHTIRAGWRWRASMSIQFYQGSYHQKRHKFRPDAVATSVQRITVKRASGVAPSANPVIWIDDQPLPNELVELLAQRDGFATAEELFKFIDQLYGLPTPSQPFHGQLIHWTDLRY